MPAVIPDDNRLNPDDIRHDIRLAEAEISDLLAVEKLPSDASDLLELISLILRPGT